MEDSKRSPKFRLSKKRKRTLPLTTAIRFWLYTDEHVEIIQEGFSVDYWLWTLITLFVLAVPIPLARELSQFTQLSIFHLLFFFYLLIILFVLVASDYPRLLFRYYFLPPKKIKIWIILWTTVHLPPLATPPALIYIDAQPIRIPMNTYSVQNNFRLYATPDRIFVPFRTPIHLHIGTKTIVLTLDVTDPARKEPAHIPEELIFYIKDPQLLKEICKSPTKTKENII